jgi:hypothetical protein
VCQFSSSVARWLGLSLTAFALAACELEKVTVPKTAPSVVVHAVLNPSAVVQVVYLERTLTGAVKIHDIAFDPSNPIATSGGIPISGSTVELIDTTGRVSRGVEDKTTRGIGTGVYRFTIAGGVRLGAKYRLHAATPEGEEVSAETRIPFSTAAATGALTRTLNRDHDTLNVVWSPATNSRAYAVRVESPFGPFFIFTDTTRLRLTGATRNLFADGFQHLLIPGFRQDITVGAVDSNFYDYYRTNNDPFTGSGIISRINGGIGLFGSMVTVTSGTLTVTADQTEPIEGRFRLTPPAADVAAPATLQLYVESKSSRSDVPDALSGRYTTSGVSPRTDGIIGELSGSAVTLIFLSNQLVTDTLDVFKGQLSNGTITGTYRKRAGTAVFVKG